MAGACTTAHFWYLALSSTSVIGNPTPASATARSRRTDRLGVDVAVVGHADQTVRHRVERPQDVVTLAARGRPHEQPGRDHRQPRKGAKTKWAASTK